MPFYRAQTRLVLRNCGVVAPVIEEYIKYRGYRRWPCVGGADTRAGNRRGKEIGIKGGEAAAFPPGGSGNWPASPPAKTNLWYAMPTKAIQRGIHGPEHSGRRPA